MWPVKAFEKRNKQIKLDALRKSGRITLPSPTRPPRSIHRSMQHITGIRINAGLSLPSLTACVAGSLGVRKAPQLLRGFDWSPLGECVPHAPVSDPSSEQLTTDNRSKPP